MTALPGRAPGKAIGKAIRRELAKAFGVFFAFVIMVPTASAEDCVILLHGLASHPLVMKPLEVAIDIQPEFRVVNQGYNSYSDEITTLARDVLPLAIDSCALEQDEAIHFVTHSMGGLLLRSYLAENEIPRLAAVVMIAPPNHGSEIVDWLDRFPLLPKVLGPAGEQLGTSEDDLPALLPAPQFRLGIIAGTQENRMFWRTLLPGEDDGKVSTESAQTENMDDYRQVYAKHSELLFERETIEQVLSFLRYGRFDIHQLNCEP